MEIFFIRLLQFILAISLLVLLHEGGHMFFYKLFGVRVEKFFIFFDVGIGKWTGKLFSFRRRGDDTEYGMGWLPLGGYCKISGMIDESFDTEQMKKPAQPWEFRTKPAWQRLLIMIGGVLVNFVLALFIYSMVLFHWGETYIPVKDMSMGMKFNAQAKALGFQDHDVLIGTDKGAFREFNVDVYRDLSEAQRADIIRNGKPMSINLPGDINLLDMLKATPGFLRPFIPAEVDSVLPKSPAALAGIRKGDKILALGNTPVDSWNAYQDEVSKLADAMTDAKTPADSLRLRTSTVTFLRNGKDTIKVAMVLTPELMMGTIMTNLATYYKPVTIHYGFFESFPAGARYGVNVLAGYVGDMKYVFTADGAKSLGGFVALGSLFPATWDWHVFWLMTAFFSIILAFMNILPIPALDGGHVLFLCYEMITGRKPSETFLIRAEYVGFSILILLLLLANLNDILRLLGYL